MELFNLRQNLKKELATLNIEPNDVDFIIAEVLGVSVTELALIQSIPQAECETIKQKVQERKMHKPVDKIFNRAYFYGLKFHVDQDVLTPRADSEILVETAINYIKQNNYKTCLDMCTGSGCLAIAIKKNVDIDVTAVDISQTALNIALLNAKNNATSINFVNSNMFSSLSGKFDIIISNPPYISTKELQNLDKEVLMYDPTLALCGGDTGLDFYNIIHDNCKNFINKNGMLILEIGEDQQQDVKNIFHDYTFIECVKDYGGHDRVMVFRN